MASPTRYSAGSPPAPTSFALPRQRPSLALPGGLGSRKPSFASAASSAHPLRQTSFPPPDSLEAQHAAAADASLAYSPSIEGSLDDFSDTEIQSAISGPAGGAEDGLRKRKRGEKRSRGRPPKHPRTSRVSIANGEEGKQRHGPASVVTGDGDADNEEDDEDEEAGAGGSGRVPIYAGGELTAEELQEQHERNRVFYETVPWQHKERYDSYLRTKLRVPDVRRLVNQTLSQSVPQNIVLAVGAYSKMFAGRLIEIAREVQAEWEAVEEKRADGSENPAYQKLKTMHESRGGENVAPPSAHAQDAKLETNGAHTQDERSSPVQKIDASSDTVLGESTQSQPSGDSQLSKETRTPILERAGGLARFIEEPDRGPLTPDHLREALRRYKMSRLGGAVGFTGLSLEGRENTAARLGGRRLFR